MTDEILAIDHLMIHVPDSQEAGDLFERLGLTVTPKSVMPGLSNRLVCFEDTPHEAGICNYLELMALEDPATAPPPMPDLLRPLGPVSTVMAVDDARAATARLIGEGMAIGPVLDLQRDWLLPDGDVITPAFAVAIPELGQAPNYWNYCQHKTAQHYVRPDFVTHPNTAYAFDEVYAVVDDPEAVAAHYQTYWRARHENGRLSLPYGPTIRLLTEEGLAEVLPGDLTDGRTLGLKGIRIRVRDLGRAQEVLTSSGVPTVPVGEGIAVRAADAAGCAIVFQEHDATDR